MSAPAISVILPTHNRAHLLPRAIASVLHQTFTDFELIVVDDGSTDGTPELLSAIADPRLVHVRTEAASGDAGARNLGAARARGDWLAFQDSDDEWVPHCLAELGRLAARAGSRHAAIASALVRRTPQSVETIDWPVDGGDEGCGEIDARGLAAGMRAYLQTMLIRREAFTALGGFDTGLKARSDFDLCLRLVRQHRLLASREILAVSYETTGSLSLDAGFRREDLVRLLERHGDLIAADARVHARYRYALARAELACGSRRAAARAAVASLRLHPWVPRAWALLALSPFGARGLAMAAACRRRWARQAA